jgi:hypothetical protein
MERMVAGEIKFTTPYGEIAVIRHDLDPDDKTVAIAVFEGQLTIYKSANNMAMDQAALVAARRSSYAPKVVDCAPTQGIVLFHAEFKS